MSKKIFCLICSLIISLSIFVIHSFAINDFTNQPIPNFVSYDDNLINGLLVFSNSSGTQQTFISSFSNNIYSFSVNNNNLSNVYFVSENNSPISIFVNRNDWISGNTINSNNLSFDSNNNLYYFSSSMSYTNGNVYLPVFNDFNSGLSAIRNYIDSGESSDIISYTTHVSLEPGTVLYIGYNPNIDLNITGTTRFPMRSTFFGGNFPDSSQTYSFTSSLPQSGTTFPLPNAQKLPWVKDEPYNILGQSFNAKLGNFVLASSSQGFYAIHNPYFVNVENFNASGDLNTNSTLELDISGYTSLRIYPLQDEILNSSSPDDFNIYWTGSSIDNGDGTGTVSWTPTSEDGSDVSNIGSNPNNLGVNGGGNLDSSSIIQDIKNTLDRFVENFISFVSAPISHIQQLISAGSGFMSALQGMYAWLPAQIQGYLISALTLIIAIGVFKVFL